MFITGDAGHALVGAVGARGNGLKEEVEARKVLKRLGEMFIEHGHQFKDCKCDNEYDKDKQLGRIVTEANKHKADLFLSIHLNSYKNSEANGVETFSLSASGKGDAYARNIQNELVKAIGWTNRGKKEANFYVLRKTNAPAVLVELGFITNKSDMNKFNVEKIAKAIFKAITGTNYIESKPSVQAPTTSNAYRIYADGKQCGTAYANHKNILNMVEAALKNNAAIIEIKKK